MRRRVRTYLIAGLLTVLPLFTTAFVLVRLFRFLDNVLDPLIDFHIPGLGLASGVVLIVAVGALTTNIVGRRITQMIDGMMSKIPLARALHPAGKQMLTALLMEDRTAFRRIVLVEWPRRGAYAVAFVTGEAQGRIRGATAERLLTVFIMRTPNPTAGYVCLVPESQTIPLEMRVQDALKLIMSGGLVVPPLPRSALGRAKPTPTAEPLRRQPHEGDI